MTVPAATTKPRPPQTTAALLKVLTPEIARALPRGMDPDRLARLVTTEVRKSRNAKAAGIAKQSLEDCTHESFAGALLTSSALGLEPGVNGECYLVPYRDSRRGVVECQLIIGYQGVVKLFWQHPRARGVQVEWVGANDHFVHEDGLNPVLIHKKAAGDRGEPVAFWAVVKVADADPIVTVLTAAEVKDLRRGKVGSSGDIKDPQHWMERKGLALDTPIPTPSGWTTMADIQIGDQVYDMDGVPVAVTVKSEVKHLPCYRVTFTNGEQIICDHEHIWVAKIGQSDMRVRDIKEMHAAKQAGKSVTVPVARALAAEVEKLPIDPWLLGYWLGNGRRDAASLTCNALDTAEVVERIAATVFQVGTVRPDQRSNAVAIGVRGGFKAALRDHGILHTKRIPAEYRRAAEWQRRELLTGLIDSDGHLDGVRGRAHFSSTDEYLADLVAELAASLGEVVYRTAREVSGYGLTVTSHEVHWKPVHNPSSLRRKSANYQCRSLAPYRPIESIEVVESVPTQCIAVDSPSRTYLAGRTMVPTHNTVLKQALKLAPKTTRLDHAIQADDRPGTDLVRSQAIELPSTVASAPDYIDGEVMGEQDQPAEETPAPDEPAEVVEPPADVQMASRKQLAQLKQIRDAEKYDSDADWFGFLTDVLGAPVGRAGDITAEQAERIIADFTATPETATPATDSGQEN